MSDSQKNIAFEQKLKHEGYFSFADLYKFIYTFLRDAKYQPIKEETYEEKLVGDLKEIRIVWKAEKEITDYFKNHIQIKFRARISDVEVERGGKREKTNKGSIEMEISADLESDYEKQWEKSPMKKFWRGIYDRYIIRSTKDEYMIKLSLQAQTLVEDIKSFLVLEGKR